MVKKPKYRLRRVAVMSERLLLVSGVLLLGLVLAAYIHKAVMVRRSMQSFEAARNQHALRMVSDKIASSTNETPDATSPENHAEARLNLTPRELSSRSLAQKTDVPLAILRIPKIHLVAPVLTGTDEIALNRGVGQIAGTAVPGEKGNIGLAGHRDSFFRNLKDIRRGDAIELETISASATYIVENILITSPEDTSVLQPSAEQTLTLVTCYPFHYIGPAPRRFVVQASLK